MSLVLREQHDKCLQNIQLPEPKIPQRFLFSKPVPRRMDPSTVPGFIKESFSFCLDISLASCIRLLCPLPSFGSKECTLSWINMIQLHTACCSSSHVSYDILTYFLLVKIHSNSFVFVDQTKRTEFLSCYVIVVLWVVLENRIRFFVLKPKSTNTPFKLTKRILWEIQLLPSIQ